MIVVKRFQKLSLHGFLVGYKASETGFPHHFACFSRILLRQSDVGLQRKTLLAVWQENSRLALTMRFSHEVLERVMAS